MLMNSTVTTREFPDVLGGIEYIFIDALNLSLHQAEDNSRGHFSSILHFMSYTNNVWVALCSQNSDFVYMGSFK